MKKAINNKIEKGISDFEKNEKEKTIRVGSRVTVNNDVNDIYYISKRPYISIKPNAEGTVVRFSATKKVGVQFDEPIFLDTENKVSSLNSGCHGYGKMNHCIYLPINYLTLVYNEEELLLNINN